MTKQGQGIVTLPVGKDGPKLPPHINPEKSGLDSETRQRALELCQKIEELPASDLQTEISVKASELLSSIESAQQKSGQGGLRPEECLVLGLLAEAYTKFVELPVLHDWDQREFMHAIHQAQILVLARPGKRQLKADGPAGDIERAIKLIESVFPSVRITDHE